MRVTARSTSLKAAILRGGSRNAVTTRGDTLSYEQLRDQAMHLSERLVADAPIGLWATAEVATVVGLCAALIAGAPVVPLNPKSGPSELGHVVTDAGLQTILAHPSATLPDELATLRLVPVNLDGDYAPICGDVTGPIPDGQKDSRTALIMYTSGTTGPPKGVMLTTAAIEANLQALADRWEWSDRDELVHALPLFHVHGLVLGVLGPIYVGGSVSLVSPFTVEAVAHGLANGATMLFAVPTMYHRIAVALETDARLADALGGARLLVSGSGPLTTDDYRRVEAASGQRIVERYGMTETLIITSGDLRAPATPGTVGRPLAGVALRVVDENGDDVAADNESVGEVLVKSDSLFEGYLRGGRSPDGPLDWFRTGDLGTLSRDGTLRLVGRASTDLVKSGGFRIGTGEIEGVLRDHPSVEDVAVRGVADDDLGERVVAWVVRKAGTTADSPELIEYVSQSLSAHKRPREIYFVTEIPRNAMGKVQKQLLSYDGQLKSTER